MLEVLPFELIDVVVVNSPPDGGIRPLDDAVPVGRSTGM